MISVEVFPLNAWALMPTFGTDHSACFDLSACLIPDTLVRAMDAHNQSQLIPVRGQSIVIPSHYRVLIPTGLIFHIPSGHSMRIHPRSGTSFRDGLTLTNAEGVIDSDYVGETLISVFNLSAVDVVVDHEDRIAQGEIVQMLIPEFFKSSSVPETMTRSGGFGSTGRGRRAEAT